MWRTPGTSLCCYSHRLRVHTTQAQVHPFSNEISRWVDGILLRSVTLRRGLFGTNQSGRISNSH